MEDFEISLPPSVNPTLELPDANLLQYYEDIHSRIAWITGEIDDACFDVVQRIIKYNREDEGIPVEKRKPFRIVFNSPGGSLDMADILVSTIKLSKTPVYGIALGMVASAASIIYLSCHKRYALETSYFVIHKGSCNNGTANYNELMAAMDDYKRQVEKMIQFYIENTEYTEEEIRKNINTDWYVRLPEAQEKGIVNEVLTSLDTLL